MASTASGKHGVMKVILELEGERMVKYTRHGFFHRGVEKLAEDGTTSFIRIRSARYSPRTNFAYCRAVGNSGTSPCPSAAEDLSTMVGKTGLIGQHSGSDSGARHLAMTVFFYCFVTANPTRLVRDYAAPG